MSSVDQNEQQQLHIVMFPWLAFGHLMPFLKLSTCLASKGHRITFLSTPRNIARLPISSLVTPDLAPLIRFVELPPPVLTVSEEDRAKGLILPDNAEATTDVPPEKVELLKKAFDEGLQKPLLKFLEEMNPKPNWLIHDFLQYWVPGLVKSSADPTLRAVPTAYFSVFPAAALGFTGSPEDMMMGGGPPPYDQRGAGYRRQPEDFTVSPDWVDFPSEVFFRQHEAQWFAGAYGPNASGVSDMYRFGATVRGVDAVFIRTCDEYEGPWTNLLRTLYKKPVLSVGLLPPPSEGAENSIQQQRERAMPLFQWLDGKKPGSVVYVALGSEAALSLELLHELALGLEKSELSFLWALRRPIGLPDNVQLLPPGFEDRIGDRGLVTMGLAPQLEILSHSSVGGFLTHAGWSSTVEGMQTGRPLVLLPIFVDQGLNTRVMVHRKVGVELPRDSNGAFTRDGVAESVRTIMVGEQAQEFAANATELQKIFADVDLHDRYIDDFISFLHQHRASDSSSAHQLLSTDSEINVDIVDHVKTPEACH